MDITIKSKEDCRAIIKELKQHANKFNYIIETHIENQKSLEKYDGVKIKIK